MEADWSRTTAYTHSITITSHIFIYFIFFVIPSTFTVESIVHVHVRKKDTFIHTTAHLTYHEHCNTPQALPTHLTNTHVTSTPTHRTRTHLRITRYEYSNTSKKNCPKNIKRSPPDTSEKLSQNMSKALPTHLKKYLPTHLKKLPNPSKKSSPNTSYNHSHTHLTSTPPHILQALPNTSYKHSPTHLTSIPPHILQALPTKFSKFIHNKKCNTNFAFSW